MAKKGGSPPPQFVTVRPMSDKPSHFPPPWTIDEGDACFIVRDKNGEAQVLHLLRGGAGATLGGQC